jgi:hypothetical protein
MSPTREEPPARFELEIVEETAPCSLEPPAPSATPTREEVLEGLRRLREDVGPEPRRAAEQVRDEEALDRAIAYLEPPPSGSLLQPIQSADGAVEVLRQMRRDVGIPSWEAHRVTLLDPIPEGPPVSARNGHEPQHATAPTWCKHCGEFACYWGPERKCSTCGGPTTCYGTYEGITGYGCDTCCGHGCEDGHCDRLVPGGDLCAHPGEHLYDSETVAGRKKIMEVFG